MHIRSIRASGAMSVVLASILPFAPLVAQGVSSPSAQQALDLAIERMGGGDALRRIERARFETVTLWHRQSFEDRPFGDVVGSYERTSDLRDYTIPAWRNARRPISASAASMEIIDLVRDTVAARFAPQRPASPSTWGPLNVAYLDERHELFAFAPERVLLAARAATDLASLSDTLIDGIGHRRVRATVDRIAATIFLNRSTGFLSFVRYWAAQPNDFGLAPFGEMEVDLWYGAWRLTPLPGTAGITYPGQWDITRIGRPYKRITLLSARFDPVAPADSFAISDADRRNFLETATKPMWDLPLDSARIIDGRFAVFGTAGATASAVKIGKRWVQLEGSLVPARVDTDLQWLRARDPDAAFGALVVTTPGAVRGGVTWFVKHRVAVYVGSGARRGTEVVLRNWNASPAAVNVVDRGRWLSFDGDSLWIEPIDYPGSPRGLVVWVPSLRWVYQPMAIAPLQLGLLMEHVRKRGWPVERIGTARSLVGPAPAPTAPAPTEKR